jgi:hypothetical protein
MLAENYEGTKILTERYFDTAIVGITNEDRVVYDFDKLVEALVTNEHMKLHEAQEYIEYNVIRALPYIKEQAPVILYSLNEDM